VEEEGGMGDVFCGIVGRSEEGKQDNLGGRGEYTGGGVCGTADSLCRLDC